MKKKGTADDADLADKEDKKRKDKGKKIIK